MQDFGTLLHTYLKEKHNYSISAFAKRISISAGLLNHIFNGKRTMTPEKFLLTINSGIFDLEERETLKTAYFIGRYGEKDYEKISLLSDTLKKFRFGEAPEISGCTDINAVGYGELTERREIFSALNELFLSTGNTVYTNIPHANNIINHVLYKLTKDYPDSRMVRFIPNYSVKFTQRNLITLLSILRFAKARVNTVSLDNVEVEHLDKTTLFPYFVISDSIMIILDAQCKKGVAFTGKIVKDKYRITELSAESSAPVVNFFSDEISAVNHIINYEDNLIHSLRTSPCFLALEDLSFLVTAANDFPNKQELVSYLMNRRSDKQRINFCTQAGLEKFLESGKSYELSETYIKRFSPKAKQEFIESLISTVESSRTYHNYFLSRTTEVSKFFSDVDITVYEKSALVTSVYDTPNEKSFSGEISIHIPGGELLRIIDKYVSDYLPISGDVLPKQTTLLYLKGLLIDCRTQNE